MSAEILKGPPVAAALDEKTVSAVRALKEQGIIPCLALLRVGETADAIAYERSAIKRCEKLGIKPQSIALPDTISQAGLIEEIEKLNCDSAVHGVLMFRPLPKSLDESTVCAALSPCKDVDGITASSMAKIYSGSGEGFAPCTAQSVMEILRYYGIQTEGKRAAVIGRSLVIGRPAAMLLLAANASVSICHSKSTDMAEIVRAADIVVVAVGKGESIGREYFREGQTVIDVGINMDEVKQKLVGDVRYDEACGTVAAITPVPGGVGSVTTAVLAAHVVEAAARITRP